MRQISLFLVGALVAMTLVITGCQKQVNQGVSSPQAVTSQQEIAKQLLESKNPISDEDFYRILSGRTLVPIDVEISDYVKRQIIFQDMNLTEQAIESLQPRILNDYLEDYERDAKTYYADPTNPNNQRPWTVPLEASVVSPLAAVGPVAPSTQILYAVPHCWEFNATENPKGYYWCGHANLKSVAKYHGTTKTLSTLHTIFQANSPGGYSPGRCLVGGVQKYCASMLDLLYAAQLSQNSGYGWSSTGIFSSGTMSTWYQKLKDGVDYNRPCIVASTYLYPVGHFYTVMGYTHILNNNGSINYTPSKVILRDNAVQNSTFGGELQVSVQTFFNARTGNDILIVRP